MPNAKIKPTCQRISMRVIQLEWEINALVNPYVPNEKCTIIKNSIIETARVSSNSRATGSLACAEYSQDRERDRQITEWLSRSTNQCVACSVKGNPQH